MSKTASGVHRALLCSRCFRINSQNRIYFVFPRLQLRKLRLEQLITCWKSPSKVVWAELSAPPPPPYRQDYLPQVASGGLGFLLSQWIQWLIGGQSLAPGSILFWMTPWMRAKRALGNPMTRNTRLPRSSFLLVRFRDIL